MLRICALLLVCLLVPSGLAGQTAADRESVNEVVPGTDPGSSRDGVDEDGDGPLHVAPQNPGVSAPVVDGLLEALPSADGGPEEANNDGNSAVD